jgi:hypothetical protein
MSDFCAQSLDCNNHRSEKTMVSGAEISPLFSPLWHEESMGALSPKPHCIIAIMFSLFFQDTLRLMYVYLLKSSRGRLN